MRQAEQPFLARGLAAGYQPGAVLDRHSHDWVLVYASEGVVSVQTDDGACIVPPDRSVWIPSGVTHASGESVTSTALEVGYESTSAFIEAFPSVLGTTPGRYHKAD